MTEERDCSEVTDNTYCIDPKEYLEAIRELIQHENKLLNYRLTWMWALQGVLFSATGFLWDSAFLVFVIASVGILSCASIGYSIQLGSNAVKALAENGAEYKRKLNIYSTFPPVIGIELLKGKCKKGREWLLPSHMLPPLMFGAWLLFVGFRIAIELGCTTLTIFR